MTDRLTLNLGGRFEHYVDGCPEQEFTPNGTPVLANWTDPRLSRLRRAAHRRRRATWPRPRLRAARRLRLRPDRRQPHGAQGVLRPVLLQLGRHAGRPENPVGRAQLRYSFLDLERQPPARRPAGAGTLDSTQGGGGFVRIDRDTAAADGSESFDQPRARDRAGLSGRVSYVYKNMRNEWGEIDAIRTPAYTVPFTFVDLGADNVAGTADDQTFQTFDRPPSSQIGSDRVYTNPAEQQGRLPHRGVRAQSPLRRQVDAADVVRLHLAEPVPRLVDDGVSRQRADVQLPPVRPDVRRQRQRNVDAVELQDHRPLRVAVRHRLLGIVEGAERRQWGRSISVPFPGDGTQTVRVEPVTANRGATVQILDFRFDKTVRVR